MIESAHAVMSNLTQLLRLLLGSLVDDRRCGFQFIDGRLRFLLAIVGDVECADIVFHLFEGKRLGGFSPGYFCKMESPVGTEDGGDFADFQ